MPNSIFPLCWESTGDQWWYATPIDWAAANGLCDLVKELLRIDPNLLIKLTSLGRIRRLETVWEDDIGMGTGPDNGIAQCRAKVARSLLLDCEPKSGDVANQNALIRAGYRGWLLYTASAAGDVAFVKDLLERDPLAVFGEGEYGITDILYGAARSRNPKVFRVLLDYAMNVNKDSVSADGNFVEEMMSRAVHAAARGGNLEVLKELLLDCSDVSSYRDAQGSTILHSASGKGQVEVVKYLIEMYDIINFTDNQGNTALHVAAYKGFSFVVETLALASPVLVTSRNNAGYTFLHMAVTAFQSPGFHRIDQQMELLNQLVSNKIINLKTHINITNNEGKTALHIAVAENIQCNVVELLMTVQSVDLNIEDCDGFTPLDLLKRQPKTATSEILIRKIATAGGFCTDPANASRNTHIRHSTMQGVGKSPGTSFRLPDPDLLYCKGNGNESDVSCEPPSSRFSSCSSEQTTTHFDSSSGVDVSERNKRSGSTNSASERLKSLLQWPRKVDKSYDRRKSREEHDKLISLRQRFSKTNVFPSPSAKEKFAASLMQGVIQATPPKSRCSSAQFSPSTPYLESLASSPTSVDKVKGKIREGSIDRKSKFYSGPLTTGRQVTMDENHRRVSSFSKTLMNQYFCFGAQGLAVEVEDSVTYKAANRSCRRLVF